MDDALPPSFLKNWVPVQMQLDAPESSWIDKIYGAVRGMGPGVRAGFAKKKKKEKRKPDKAFQARLDQIEGAARQWKSSQRE